MFDSLSSRLEGIVKRLRGKGRLTEDDVDEMLKEIRTALLEADVNVGVVRNVVARIREQAIGARLSEALDPGQQVIKIVNSELTAMLGGETLKIHYASRPPTVVLMAGLQGSGKTTNSAKLARWFKSQGRQPLMVGVDLQRPAAVEQLRTLGRQIDVPVFSQPGDPVETARRGLEEARRLGRDVLIVDTAGRLSIDAEMMEQVRQISSVLQPNYTFLVVDAMTGQDAVGVAEAFHATLAIDGVILTKLDGDARGGAALSVKEVIGRPIAFASTGEKLSEFEQFHPDRMAGRILGMGDMLTLIEQAEQAFDKDQAEQAAEKLMDGEFTLEDFLEQMQALKKMGPLSGLMGMMPGIPKEMKDAQIGDDQLKPIEAIIHSMTPLERRKPELINGSRRTRIANGSGTTVGDVNRLVKQFAEMQKMMKRFGGMAKQQRGKKGKKGGRVMPPMGGMPGLPGGFPGMPGGPGLPGQGLPGMPGGFGPFN
ncbi:MAG: signal recognition particle protein [Actinobacteria bacterium]|uniref:signal-recognition-particle GTPase n=1 Tax=freshwater metagenome TaxID=449393 RepID=A0A6J6Q1M3_9ZZZZ|nr:signal recognition particle protein [Actinomycetota bacterium]MSW76110.1 signal recognition particle protein [Actinomycetota bacterium]MSX93041.1 signal recognition particle protein [Actinomycetota bacterium]MSZ81820.1 signal recognition particle protein [Actinomycetota bacterium]MTB16659.1 signal recognition particle protein [Actinomycetota bacterium]